MADVVFVINKRSSQVVATGSRTVTTGAVNSVNGMGGDVVLDAAAVGADPAGTAASAVTAHTDAEDPHPGYVTGAAVSIAVTAHETNPTPHTTITQVRKFGFDTDSGETAGTGEMVWNEADGTVDLGMPGGVTLQVGQEQLIRVLNKTGSTIQNMHVVYITGAQGNRVTAAQAQANNASADKTLAVATQDIANNAEGFATILGLVRGINTSAWAEGTELWLSADVAGAITNARPAAPNHQVRVGYVVRSHATEGSIYVTVNIGADLSHLHDVVITAPNDNDVLAYDAATQTWRNEPQTGGSGEVNTASNLGTGAGVFASKVAADLQFKSLVAGANVSITSNATTVTISATGGGGGSGSAPAPVVLEYLGAAVPVPAAVSQLMTCYTSVWIAINTDSAWGWKRIGKAAAAYGLTAEAMPYSPGAANTSVAALYAEIYVGPVGAGGTVHNSIRLPSLPQGVFLLDPMLIGVLDLSGKSASHKLRIYDDNYSATDVWLTCHDGINVQAVRQTGYVELTATEDVLYEISLSHYDDGTLAEIGIDAVRSPVRVSTYGLGSMA